MIYYSTLRYTFYSAKNTQGERGSLIRYDDWIKREVIFNYQVRVNHKLNDLLTFFENLKTLDFSQSGITQLEISGYTCPHLKSLGLWQTKQIQSLKLSGTFLNLKNIDLYDSGITQLEISGDTLPNLESLNLMGTRQLKSLKLSGTLHNLKNICLYESGIAQVEVSRDCCPNLQSNDQRIKIIDRKRKHYENSDHKDSLFHKKLRLDENGDSDNENDQENIMMID